MLAILFLMSEAEPDKAEPGKKHGAVDRRTLLIQCPDCSTSIEVDARTGAILNHQTDSKQLGGADFDELFAKVDEDRRRADSLFEQGRAAHEDRERLLDDRYKEALDRVDEVDDGTPPPSPFDLD